MFYLIAILCFSPFLGFLIYSIRKGYFNVNKNSDSDRFVNRIQLSNEAFLKSLKRHYKKIEKKEDYTILEFSRISAWGSPGYTIFLTSSGNVFYDGISSVRLTGKYRWKIKPSSVKKIFNHVDNTIPDNIKNQFSYFSKIDTISKVSFKLFSKQKNLPVIYDHAAIFPPSLSSLEKHVDSLINLKPLWLNWEQELSSISIKFGESINIYETISDDILVNMQDTSFTLSCNHPEWMKLRKTVEKINTMDFPAADYNTYNLPENCILVVLRNGFRFIVSIEKNPEIFDKIYCLIQEISSINDEKLVDNKFQ